jgi:hypothetical protein
MSRPLRDWWFFCRVRVKDGTVAWPNGFDLDPAWLYVDGRTVALAWSPPRRGASPAPPG